MIILISDGDHNVGVPPESVIAELQQSGTKVIAVALGASISTAGEAALKNLAAQTSGAYFRASTPPQLYNFMARFANDFGGYHPGVEIPVAMTTGARREVPVFIEAGATHTNFSVVTPDPADSVTISLVKPSGAVIGEAGATGVVFAAEPTLRTFRVTAPEAGTWKLVINAGTIRTGDLTAMANIKHDGVYFHAWVDDEGTTFAPSPVALHASPAYDGRAVVGSVVTGTATRPDGTKTPVVLYDDGQLGHGDVTANDGVYSVLFDQYTKDGTYIFELTSQNTNGHLSEGEPIPNEDGVVETFPILPAPPFNRSTSTAAVVAGLTEGDVVWVDDGIPQGAITQGEWYWVGANPAPFMGGAAHQSKISELSPYTHDEHSFVGASAKLPVAAGDRLFAYVFLDPNSSPDQIMLQWNDGDGWEHRAYWGNNFVDIGVQGTESRRYMGDIPSPGGVWHRLEIPASYVGLEGKSVYGMSFGYYKQNDRARVSWDLAGKTSQPTLASLPLSSLTPLWRFRADSYGYSYSTNDIGRAEQSNQGVRAYVHPNQAAGTVPFYRFRNADRYYFYSTARTPAQGWFSDGIAFYIYPPWQTAPPSTVPLHMFHNPKGFFYTTHQSEGFGIGYTYGGVSGYVHDANPLVPAAPWGVYWSSGTIHWQDNSSNETGFKIERFSAAGGFWSEIAVVGANVTSYSGVSGKDCQDAFRVRAYNGLLHSNYSSPGGAGVLTPDGKICVHAIPNQQSGTAPSVALVSPADGAVFKAGAFIPLKAEAFDAQGSGTIAKVEFFLQGGMKVGEATQPPYTLAGGPPRRPALTPWWRPPPTPAGCRPPRPPSP